MNKEQLKKDIEGILRKDKIIVSPESMSASWTAYSIGYLPSEETIEEFAEYVLGVIKGEGVK